jgi:hypothetical protein
MTALNEIYKGKTYLRSLFTRYNKNITPRPRIKGFYDFVNEHVHFILQGGAVSGGQILPDEHLAFSEEDKGFIGFFDYFPEYAISAEEQIYSFKNGQMWVHDNQTHCNFFGQQFNATLTVVFNNNINVNKTFLNLAELASNEVWECPLIYTNVNTYGTQRQESKLLWQNFKLQEGGYYAPILRDIRSPKGWVNGDTMKGAWVAIKFQAKDSSKFVFLSAIQLKYIVSQPNLR